MASRVGTSALGCDAPWSRIETGKVEPPKIALNRLNHVEPLVMAVSGGSAIEVLGHFG
jgi:hypothetical protein